MKDLNVIIVGAGIGGLQTSLALAQDGHHVTVLESAKAFEEVCILIDLLASSVIF
jgi:2-polyprenyl-6-methoxyphenol hydroxylase-like FAD-dependent oxidoreductase